MSRGAEVRPIGRADLAPVELLQRACNPVPWGPRLLEATVWSPHTLALVAVSDGAPVGYLIAQRLAGLWHLLDVGVAGEQRRQGIGGTLVRWLLVTAGRDASEGVTLEVRAGNAGAIALYRLLGFTDAGRRPSYYSDNGEDALIMTWLPAPEAA